MSEPLYTVILERSGPRPLAEIGKILAATTGIHPTDAALRVRYGGGLVADGVPLDTAERLARALEALGMRTRRIEADRWGLASPGRFPSSLEIREDVLVANLQSGGRIEVRKDCVRAIDLHGLAPESRIEEARDGSGLEPHSRRGSASRWAAEGILAPDADGLDGSVPRALGNVSPRARGLLERLAEEEWSGVELTLTLFCAEPTGPLHVRKDRFDYSCLGELKMRHSLDNFLILAEEVLAAFPGLWNREPVEEFLRSLDPATIVRFKREEVQNLHRWILQWIRIDEEERPAGLTGAAGT